MYGVCYKKRWRIIETFILFVRIAEKRRTLDSLSKSVIILKLF